LVWQPEQQIEMSREVCWFVRGVAALAATKMRAGAHYGCDGVRSTREFDSRVNDAAGHGEAAAIGNRGGSSSSLAGGGVRE
jgi:hypothetical protein